MRAFVGVVAERPGDLRSREIAELGQRVLPPRGVAKSHELWVSRSGRVALHFWTNEPRIAGVDPGFLIRGDRAAAVTGYVSGGVHDPIAELLRDGSAPRRGLVSGLGGIHAICVADDSEDAVEAYNTIARVDPVYWCRNERVAVVGSRALLAHLACTGRSTPVYDHERMVPFIGGGCFASDDTPYEGVRALAPNSRLRLAPSGTDVVPIDDTELPRSVEPITGAALDDLAEALLDACRPLARLDAPLTLSVTGGKDSRLVGAALRAAGVEFSAGTAGFDDHPEVVIGRRVADVLGARHFTERPPLVHSNGRAAIGVDPLRRACDLLFATDGMLDARVNVAAGPTFQRKVSVGGHGGPLVRGDWTHVRPTREALADWLERAYLSPPGLFRDDPAGSYRRWARDWLFEQAAEVGVHDALQRFYVAYRIGRWSAAGRAGSTVDHLFFQPIFDKRFATLLQRLDATDRMRENVTYGLLERFEPALLEVPFFKDRWKFEADGPPDGGDRQRWERRAPLTVDRRSRTAFDWRKRVHEELREPLRAQILDATAADALFEVVDRDEVEALFGRGVRRDAALLWRLYSASVLLSNRWIDGAEGAQVRIPLPPAG